MSKKEPQHTEKTAAAGKYTLKGTETLCAFLLIFRRFLFLRKEWQGRLLKNRS